MEKYSVQRLFQTQLNNPALPFRVPLYQLKAVQALSGCRTSAMGSHGQYCENGHLCGVYFNSCRHRGCPQCQYTAKERWLTQWSARLLNTQHHHLIFTIPHELLPIWRFNREWFQDELYLAVAKTIKQLSRSKNHLGAQPGFLLALHTWGRNLSEHPHIHCLLSHGGLTPEGRWSTPKRKIMFPVKVIRRLFKGKFLASLKQKLEGDSLVLANNDNEARVKELFNKLGRIEWQVFACKPYAHGVGVAKYLAKYMRGGPLRNSQITHVKHNEVVFKYKSHQTKQTERKRLSLSDFNHRVLRHLPLKGKPTIRYYGLYHPSIIEKLNMAREHFKQPALTEITLPTWQQMMHQFGVVFNCIECGSKERRLCENSFAFLCCKKSSKKISIAIFFLRSIIFCARAKLLIL